MDRYQIIDQAYRVAVRPLAFQQDAEKMHNRFTALGVKLNRFPTLLNVLAYRHQRLERNLLGLHFNNPVGLAAGFDYNGHLAATMPQIGFGFNTAGTVTAQAYAGNPKPRLTRLVKSQSILVNKGFKSDGAAVVAERLDRQDLTSGVVGISVGNSNVPTVNDNNRAIDDILTTIEVFRLKPYVKYFELNISCPNTELGEPFSQPANLQALLKAIHTLKPKQPLLLKLPNELGEVERIELIGIGLRHGVEGYIIGNLAKNRRNAAFDRQEIESVQKMKGNFSGRPTTHNVLESLKSTRQHFGRNVVLVGCGGTFSPADALAKIDAGADLIQILTGLIFTGPALAGEICAQL